MTDPPPCPGHSLTHMSDDERKVVDREAALLSRLAEGAPPLPFAVGYHGFNTALQKANTTSTGLLITAWRRPRPPAPRNHESHEP